MSLSGEQVATDVSAADAMATAACYLWCCCSGVLQHTLELPFKKTNILHRCQTPLHIVDRCLSIHPHEPIQFLKHIHTCNLVGESAGEDLVD